jgi:16S rRNA (cytidine1402-2'-O)-methyltransferase
MSSGSQPTPGRLVLAGAPLGQPADASERLRAALGSVPVIAAEDTRRLRRLASDLGVCVTGRVVSFFDGNESARVPQFIDALASGEDVLVITDAGMPSVSDPGYRLVAAAVAGGYQVTALPGPSAVTTAVALCGLPVDRFCFEGFLPRKSGARRATLAELAAQPRTVVFFESPHRLAATLSDAVAAFGPDHPAAVCRELTKTYEEVRRGSLSELAEWARGDIRGEITVVLAARSITAESDPAEWAEAVAASEADGLSRKDAIASVASARGVGKRAIYEAVVAAKRTTDHGDGAVNEPH